MIFPSRLTLARELNIGYKKNINGKVLHKNPLAGNGIQLIHRRANFLKRNKMEKPDWLPEHEWKFFLLFCKRFDINPDEETYESACEKVMASMEIAFEMRGD